MAGIPTRRSKRIQSRTNDGEVAARRFTTLREQISIGNNNIEVVTRPWSDLPAELLSPIADQLRLIELLSFRGVCKDWKAAASTASAKIEGSPHSEPWLLLYGENSQCHLYDESRKRYTMSIPRLDGATCIASNQGWLLMFVEGSMFFYCPFSDAKIEIPKFPHSILSSHAAAFSSAPTTPECIVAVMHRDTESVLELNVLRRGANTWNKRKLISTRPNLGVLGSATYRDGTFHFWDKINGLLAFSVKDESIVKYTVVVRNELSKNTAALPYIPYIHEKTRFEGNDMRKKVGLGKEVSVSVCGTTVKHDYGADKIIFSEDIDAAEESESHHLKGVWIQPRFFNISPNQSWSV
ncbi:hypothetical protein F2P56_018553 [Juglans regia]|uniref:F-box/kelch-repeat protein At1g57790-like n=2 Tax=Juglans regia TaxID=51240 RepID=A0A2I4F0P2_JUGRE|nr:F-box/kelch-repeat protein At1g57790-like [Juglans regia]KAF5462556.1 hypothetical protein F2P56_018553 [Juglans regia]